MRFLMVVMMFGVVSCSTGVRDRELETSRAILRAVNAERVKRGMRKVRVDPVLSEMAGQHADSLVRRVDPTRGKPRREEAHHAFRARSGEAERRGYRVFSEVVMIGYAGDLSAVAERTMKGWLGSRSHRRAILHPDRRGMGIDTRLPSDGRYFVVGLLTNGREGR